MGMMQVRGDYSGKTYDVQFAGDEPTPEEIANATGQIQALERAFETKFESVYGDQAVDDGTAFGRGFESGLTQARSALGTTVRDFGDVVGSDFISDLGAGQEAAARRTQLSRAGTTTPFRTFDEAREGGIADTLSYLGEIAGQSGPQMGAGLAATGIGTLAGGPLVGTAAGIGVMTPFFYGSGLQRAEEQVAKGELDAVNRTNTLTAAVGSATLNTIADRLLLTGLLKPGKNIFTRAVSGGVQGTVSEVPTEIGQQILERWQAGMPLDDAEAIAEYREVGIAAGLLGGTIGSGINIVRPSLDKGTDTKLKPPVDDASSDVGSDVDSVKLPSPKKPTGIGTYSAAGLKGFEATQTPLGGLAGLTGRLPPAVENAADRVSASDVDGDNVDAFIAGLGGSQTLQDTTAEAAPMTEPEKAKTVPTVKPKLDDAALLEDARRSVTERKVASVSALQRDLKISGARAAKLISLLAAETNPIVGPADKKGRRKYIPITVESTPDSAPIVPDTITPTTELDGSTGVKPKSEAETVTKPEVKPVTESEVKPVTESEVEPVTESEQGAQLPVGTKNLRDESGEFVGDATDQAFPDAGATGSEFVQSYDKALNPVAGPKISDTSGLNYTAEKAPVKVRTEVLEAISELPPAQQKAMLTREIEAAEAESLQGNLLLNKIGELFLKGGATKDTKQGKAARSILLQQGAISDVNQQPDITDLEDKKRILNLLEMTDDAAKKMKDPNAFAARAFFKNFLRPVDAIEEAAVVSVLYAPASSPKNPKIQKRTSKVTKFPEGTSAMASALNPEDGFVYGDTIFEEAAEVSDAAYEFYSNETQEKALQALQWMESNMSDDVNNFASDVIAEQLDMAVHTLTPAERDAQIQLRRERKSELQKGRRDEDKRLREMSAAEEAQQRFENSPEGQDAAVLAEARAVAYARQRAERIERMRSEGGYDRAQEADKKARMKALAADYTNYIRKKNKAAAAASQGQPNQLDQDQANLAEIKLNSTEEAYLKDAPLLADADLLSEANVAEVSADILLDENISQESMGLGLSQSELNAQFERRSETLSRDDDYDSRYLLASELYAQSVPLPPSIRNTLAAGDLSGALIAIANISPSKALRSVANKLAGYTGDTKIQLVSGGLKDPQGNVAAGVFYPATNTIAIDSNLGMNAHTILHEVLHAGTAAQLARKNLPEVRQLTRIYEAVKAQMPEGSDYATRSIDEFIAEAFSNPDFQVKLAGIPMSGLKFPTAWQNFKEAVRRVFRNLMGRAPESVFDRTDLLLDYILAPQLSTRAAPAMYLTASTPEGAVDATKEATDAVKPTTREELRDMQDRAKNSAPYTGAKSFFYGVSPLNILADTLKRNHDNDAGMRLNKVINKQSSKLRDKTIKLDYIVNQIKDFRRAASAEQYNALQQLVPTSTLNRIDPSVKRNIYTSYGVVTTDPVSLEKERTNHSTLERRENYIKEFTAKHPDFKITKIAPLSKDKLAVYDALAEDYKNIGEDGQRVYRTMRNYFQETYDEIAPALRDRINSISDDAAVRKTAFDKLSELLLKDSGIITPYFPLMRKGSYRLSYTAIDPQDQDPDAKPQVDRFVEYFPTKIAMMEAKQKVKDYNAAMLKRPDVIAANLDTIFDEKTGQSRPNPMLSAESLEPEATKLTPNSDYGKAPSSGFVFNVLNVLQAAGVQKMEGGKGSKVISDILDLSLDALPERSFMQGFRTRKGVRGFLGDITPTGYSLANFDLIDMMETKGRDLNRQVVQLQSSAEIQGVMGDIVKLTTDPETAEIGDRLQKIAEFGQRPNVSRWSQIATNLGFNWTMGLNFSSAALTFFDVGMSVMPLLSGKYGAGKTTRAFGDAVKAIAAAPRAKTLTVDDENGDKVKEQYDLGAFGLSLGNLDFSDPASVPEGLRDLDVLVRYATEQAQMGQSLTQETLELDMYTGDTGSDRVSRIGKKIIDTSQKWGGAMFHHSERYGREVSLVAAYKLEIDKLSNGGKKALTDADKQAAAEAAVDFVEFTLGGTASAGRPVYAQGPIGNILFLFKRFAISKYYMMLRMLNDATKVLPRDQYDTEEAYQDAVDGRRIARAQGANFLITTGLIAGASGMPLFGELGIMYDLLFRDEDEDNWDVMTKKWMGDPVYGGLVDMTGLEIGDRIALNNMLYRPPLIDKDQNPLFTLAEQLGGPVIGITSQVSRGASLIAEGNVWRGIEAASPAAVRNVMKTGRYATEGNLTLRGDEITATSPYTLAGQLLGFASHAHIEQLNMNRNERQKYSSMQDRKRKILRKANKARREGDVEGLRRAYEEANEHNSRLPSDARKLVITSDSFKNSYKNFQRVSEEMVGGMQYSPSMRRSAGEYDGGLSSPVS